MSKNLPIQGQIPTSLKAKEIFENSNKEEDEIFAEIDPPQIIEIKNYPPHPMEFSIPTYSPQEKGGKKALTYNEFYGKVFFMPPDAQIVIVRYDEQSKLFHIDPTEVVSLIDAAEDDSSVNFYSLWYEQAKLIEIGELQSATVTVDNGNFSLLAKYNGKVRAIPSNTPLRLKGKMFAGPIIDVVHFSGTTTIGGERKSYAGLVIS